MQTVSNIFLSIFLGAVLFGIVVLAFGNTFVGGVCIIVALVSFIVHNVIFKRFVEER